MKLNKCSGKPQEGGKRKQRKEKQPEQTENKK